MTFLAKKFLAHSIACPTTGIYAVPTAAKDAAEVVATVIGSGAPTVAAE
jgi:hypothetical protein